MDPTVPVLEALAWRLVEPSLVAREATIGGGSESEEAWIHRRLSAGPHGLPYQLAWEASERAEELLPVVRGTGDKDVISGLGILAKATLRLEHGVPRVHREEAWDRICRIVDPDLLAVALPDLDRHDPHHAELQRHLAWPPVLRAQQTVFHAVCADALAEIHAHLGACLTNSLQWALILSGAIPAETLWSSQLDIGQDDGAWRRALMDAQKQLLHLAGGPADPTAGAGGRPVQSAELAAALLPRVRFDLGLGLEHWPLGGDTIGNSAASALLVPERLVVFRMLWCHRRGLLSAEQRADLLGYLRVRSAFNVILSQPPGHRGLNEFRTWYDRRSALWSRPARGSVSRQRVAGRVAALGMELVVETWLLDHSATGRGPCPPLDLELRTCVPLRGRAAVEFFIALARGTRAALRRQGFPPLRVGIIHHAIKGQGREDGQDALQQFQAIWDLLESVPEIRPLLVGLDAASDELACPPRSFSEAYGWVRERLDHDAIPDDDIPIRLGFTFHAGEDFRDLLTGLRHVDEATHLLQMRAGDRLGHALALSWPVDEFYIQRANPFPTVGDHALDLWWACALLRTEEGQIELVVDVEERLVALLTDCGARPAASAAMLMSSLDLNDTHRAQSPRARGLWDALQRARDEPCPSDFRHGPRRAFLESELLDILGIAEDQRRAFAPRPGRPKAWRRIVEACQRIVRRRVLDKGLVIEINPSSNRIVGGFSTIDRLPYPNINKPGPRQPGEPANIPLCLGTDDAGIFHTSLRREYELVGRSALARGYALPDVHAWLDEIRRVGRRACFIRNTAPVGQGLYDWLARLLPEGEEEDG